VQLKQIIERFNNLAIYEQRYLSDDYDELVFFNKEIAEWMGIFTDILGPAIKPKGVKPTQTDLLLTKDYGGILDNQTLFKKKFDDVTVFAMFWPWQDNVHTTLKVVFLKKKDID
jgi:hypothetical protein